jgi:hypothetical protein
MNLNAKLTCVIMTNIRVLSSFVCIFTFVYSSNLINYTLNFLETNKNDVFIIVFSVLLGIYSLNNTFVKYKMSRDVM